MIENLGTRLYLKNRGRDAYTKTQGHDFTSKIDIKIRALIVFGRKILSQMLRLRCVLKTPGIDKALPKNSRQRRVPENPGTMFYLKIRGKDVCPEILAQDFTS